MASTVTVPRRPRLSRSRKEELYFYVFISPWIVGFLIFMAGPIIASFHGTAFDIAGKGIADPGSLAEALKYTVLLCEKT